MSFQRRFNASFEYILCDWLGTLFCHRQTLADALRVRGEQLGIEADWEQVEQAWSFRMYLYMSQVHRSPSLWQPFPQALDDALRMTLDDLGIEPSRYPESERAKVIAAYQHVPCWPEVVNALHQMRALVPLAACSIMERESMERIAVERELPFERLISSDALRKSPLSRDYYVAAARILRRAPSRILYVGEDSPQLLAAADAGMSTACIQRPGYDPLLPQTTFVPSLRAKDMTSLVAQVAMLRQPTRMTRSLHVSSGVYPR